MEAWDDIRFFLALVRYGSVRSAAAALEVNHTTVSRRLRALEHRIGSRLLHRTPDGYTLTSDGEVILASGESIERELAAAAQRVQGSDDSVSGRVRITLTDMLFELAGPTLQQVLEEHTGLQLDISINQQFDDLARRDADIALRLSPQTPDDFIGTKLARMPAAIYGPRKSGFDSRGTDLGALPWIRWQEPWKHVRLETYLDERYPEARVAARVDSYAALEQLVALGVGVAALTPWSADRRDDLIQISDTIDELDLDLWLLTHPDLRGVRRIKLIMDALTGGALKNQI